MNLNRRIFNRISNDPGYRIENKSETTEVFIYDEIGWYGINAKDFRKDLQEISGDIVVRINSPGGSVFDGMAIHNAIKDYSGGKKTVIVDGLAASAASYIALAGDHVKINQGAFFMIHDAWSLVIGNAEDMIKEAELLEKIDGQIAGFYERKTGRSTEEIKQKMSEETWFTADEALEFGLVDEVIEDENTAENMFDLSVFNKVPESLNQSMGREMRPPRDYEKALRDAGMTRKEAKAVLSRGLDALDEPEDETAPVTTDYTRDKCTCELMLFEIERN